MQSQVTIQDLSTKSFQYLSGFIKNIQITEFVNKYQKNFKPWLLQTTNCQQENYFKLSI